LTPLGFVQQWQIAKTPIRIRNDSGQQCFEVAR